jgi:endonuclease/exonuclease/phosphatase family metal-dependent hydrolase
MVERHDDRLRVATFNIRNGVALDGFDSWPFRRRATAGTVARLDCDVAGLQEVYGFQQRYLLARLPGYVATGVGRTDGRRRGERCTVLYRGARLALDDSATRWFSDTPDVAGSTSWGNRLPRIVTLARFTDLRSGRRFGLANCHLEGWPPAARHRSAAALVTWLEPDLPWIVLGDFNAGPDDEAVRTLLAADLRDVFSSPWTAFTPDTRPVLETDIATRTPPTAPDAPPASDAPPTPSPAMTATSPATTTGGFTGSGERRRIDYVFVTREWEVGEAGQVQGCTGERFSLHWHWPSDVLQAGSGPRADMTTTTSTISVAPRRPKALVALVVVQLFQALGGLAGGAVLIASPDGHLMKMPLSNLDGSPFRDFLIPGIILFVVLGMGPLAAALVLVRRPRSATLERVNPFPHEYWGWTLSGAIGAGLVIWIAVETLIVPYSFLQPFYAGVGIVIIALTLVPSVRAYYRR